MKKDIDNTINTMEAAIRLNYKNSGSLSFLIKQQKFPNAFKVNGNWRIPITDIEHYEYINRDVKIDYTPEVALSELKSFIETIKFNKELHETKTIFIQYCSLRVNSISGTTRHLRDRVLLYKRFYNNLIDTISNEVFLISTNEINEILQSNSFFKKDEKKIFISFLNYAYTKKSIEPDFQFSVKKTNNKANDKDIYSPELFHEIYQYVKLIDTHIPHAIVNQNYANMWAYTILLLTDFIRGQDLIINTPKIELQDLGIFSLDWFNQNKLSDYQIQTIINQLYMHFRHKRTSKTDELLTFIIAPDLMDSLANALVISELHRSIENSEMLLDTFIQGKYNKIKTSGKASHQRFFDQMKNSLDFKFSSLKMNRTVATYLFYSVTEEDGQDSDLALHLTQVSRSHKSADSTSKYIQATNKDGSINRVSYNLFKRGHFGWLYDHLVLYGSQLESTQNNLEEHTKLIEEIRKDISPMNLENTANYVYNSFIPLPLKNNSSNMESFMHKIYEKRQTVISKLKDYSKIEIREIITKLSNGDMPSKNENAQCLVFPKCKNPKLSNCFSCEYVIPGNLMLIQLNEELNRLIKDLDNTTNEILLQKDSMFLMHALLIWKESRIAFGDEKVNAYIPAKEKWKEIEKVAHKLSLE